MEKLPEIHVPQNKVIGKTVRPMPQDRNHERLAQTDCGIPANLPQLVPQDSIRERIMEQGQTPDFANDTGHGQLAEASQQVVVPMPQAGEEIPSSTRAQSKLLKVCRIGSQENYRQAVQKLLPGSNSYCTHFESCAPLLQEECAKLDVSRLARRTLTLDNADGCSFSRNKVFVTVTRSDPLCLAHPQLSRTHSYASSRKPSNHLSFTTTESHYRLPSSLLRKPTVFSTDTR